MNHRFRAARTGVALIAVLAVGMLTACTAQPAAAPAAAVGETAAHVFVCPDLTAVAALTAVPYSSRTAGSRACSYATGANTGASATATATVQRVAADDHRTPAAARSAAMRRGATTTDLPALSFDAFTASTAASCTAWFPAADGVLTAVTARQDGVAGPKECGTAGAVASLMVTGSVRSSAPIVAVLAQRTLLGTSTADASWPWRVGLDAGVRVDRRTGTGYLDPGSAASLASAAARIPTDAAAVVFVSGTVEPGASRLQVLNAMTAALSAASGRAPQAKLIVVGPVADGVHPTADLADLRIDLQSAASIAGAVYLDPATSVAGATGSTAALDATADVISAQLRKDGVSHR